MTRQRTSAVPYCSFSRLSGCSHIIKQAPSLPPVDNYRIEGFSANIM